MMSLPSIEELKGKWKQQVGAAKVAWGKLTEDELLKSEGHAQKLAGLVQEPEEQFERSQYARIDMESLLLPELVEAAIEEVVEAPVAVRVAEPLLQARSEDCTMRGLDPFAEVQLPQAVITLKQGVGRLIRDVSDRGVMVICDNRLVTKPYGEVFLTSLPPMRRTRSLDEAVNFLQQIKQDN